MYKTLINFVLLCFFSSTILAQEGTTLDEYRYLSKGLLYQKEMGLDAQKEGYQIDDLFTAENGAQLIGLFKKDESQATALLVLLDDGASKAVSLCIPNAKSDQKVKDLALTDQKAISQDKLLLLQQALNEFLFMAISKPEVKSYAYAPASSINPMISTSKKDETLVSRSANVEKYLAPTPEKEKKPSTTTSKNAAPTKVKIIKGDIGNSLSNRSATKNPEVKVDANSHGVVTVKVCIDKEGNVKTAKFTQRGSTTFDSYLKNTAEEAAKKIKFTKSDSLDTQCGIVRYKF